MSQNIKKLCQVEEQMKDLIKNQTRLKKLFQKGQIDDDEIVELESVLQVLEQDKKFWQDQVTLENTPEESSKAFGEADAEWIASVTGIDYQYRSWTSYTSQLDDTVVPSPGFQVAFENISKAFHMRTEAGRRLYLNLFLSDIVLLPEFNNTLRIFPGIEMSVESKGPKKRRLNGKADYIVGLTKNMDISDNTPPRECHVVAFGSKRGTMSEEDLWQCVAQTATLYKSRKDDGKEKCSVWGILSNATHWIFIYIDQDGKLWRSKEYLLDLRVYRQSQVLAIYQFLYYVIKCCYDSAISKPTPPPSNADSNQENTTRE